MVASPPKENRKWGFTVRKIDMRILGVACLLIFVATLYPAMNFDKETNAWAAFIYDYQTLLTGLFAVSAALFTVAQMRHSDRLAKEIHIEEIGIAKRDDRLRVERFIAFLPNTLLTNIKAMQDYIKVTGTSDNYTPGDVWDVKQKMSFVRAIEKLAIIDKALMDDRVLACAHLFTPDLHEKLKISHSLSSQLCKDIPDGFVAEAYKFFAPTENRPSWFGVIHDAYLGEFSWRIENLARLTHKWAKDELQN